MTAPKLSTLPMVEKGSYKAMSGSSIQSSGTEQHHARVHNDLTLQNRAVNQMNGCHVSRDRARHIMGAFPTGVAVVTARDRTISVGVTVNSLTSVSLEPPTLLICLDNRLHTLKVIQAVGMFGINFLASHQSELASHFAARKPVKFLNIQHHHDLGMVPILDEQIGYAVCEIEKMIPAHDHTLIMASVIAGERSEGSPLTYYNQEFGYLNDGA